MKNVPVFALSVFLAEIASAAAGLFLFGIGEPSRFPTRRRNHFFRSAFFMETAMYKIETFIPESALQDIRQALLSVDAGRIGKYRGCMTYSPESLHAFRASPVTGVWYSGEGSNPATGIAGEWSEEPELKIEVNVEDADMERTIKAIRDAHPYEEPVINCLKLFVPV